MTSCSAPLGSSSLLAARISKFRRALFETFILLLLCCGPANAARLQAAAWADTAVIAASSSAVLNFPATQAMIEESLLLDAVLLEADIGAFSRASEYPVRHTKLPAERSEFSSLGVVAAYLPLAIVTEDQDAGVDQSDNTANGVASISLMALASLFGIGVIGMGTVGRRRHK